MNLQDAIHLTRTDANRLAMMADALAAQSRGIQKQLRVLENGYPIAIDVTEDPTIGVDTPGDVARVEALLGSRRGGSLAAAHATGV